MLRVGALPASAFRRHPSCWHACGAYAAPLLPLAASTRNSCRGLLSWPQQGNSSATPWAGLCRGTWQEQLPSHSQAGPQGLLAGAAQSPLDGLEHALLLGIAVQVAVCEAAVGGARRKTEAGK